MNDFGNSLSAELMAIIDRFIRDDQPQMSREQALAYIVYDWAIGMRYVEAPPEAEN